VPPDIRWLDPETHATVENVQHVLVYGDLTVLVQGSVGYAVEGLDGLDLGQVERIQSTQDGVMVFTVDGTAEIDETEEGWICALS
jgi:hypothetical protein